jgi:hypothetical protein
MSVRINTGVSISETGRSVDAALDALSNIHRRRLLLALLEHNPQDEVPTINAAREDETDSMEQLVQMQHVHLPKLAEYGFIDWDEDSHEVSKGTNFDEIRPLLELMAEHEDELPDEWR